MNVLYCGDKNITDGLMLSALSLMKHVSEPLHIYVMTMGCSHAGRVWEPLEKNVIDVIDQRLRAEHDHQSFAMLLDATEQFAAQPPTANMQTKFTPCCMLRLYADRFPELPDQLLYLDYDVLCRRDCSDFYHQPLENWEIIGVLDHYGKHIFRRRLFRQDYLNSGVLLLNMSEIRKTGLFEKCRRQCSNRKMFFPDQDALNILATRKKLADRCYNEQRALHEDTVFHHFSTGFRFVPRFRVICVKPWQQEKMHQILNLYEYDSLLQEFFDWKEKDVTCHDE